MPVPTQELKLEIVNAATGKILGARSTPGTDGALVVRDFPDGARPRSIGSSPPYNRQADRHKTSGPT